MKKVMKMEREERTRKNTEIRKAMKVEEIAKEEIEMEEKMLEMGKTELPTMPNWHLNIDQEGLSEHFAEQRDPELHHCSVSSAEEVGGVFSRKNKKSIEEMKQHPNVLEDSFVQIEVMNAAEKLRVYSDKYPCLQCRKKLMKFRM